MQKLCVLPALAVMAVQLRGTNHTPGEKVLRDIIGCLFTICFKSDDLVAAAEDWESGHLGSFPLSTTDALGPLCDSEEEEGLEGWFTG